MKKNDPNASSESGELNEKQNGGPSREDSDRSTEKGYSRFAKDKRKRIVRVEKNPAGPDSPSERNKERTSERRSYNPNFTSDNKKRDERPHRVYERDFNRSENPSDDYFNSDRYYEDRNRERGKDRNSGFRSRDNDNKKRSYVDKNERSDRKPSGRYDNKERNGDRPYNRDNGKRDNDRGGYRKQEGPYQDRRREDREFGHGSGQRDNRTRKPGGNPRKQDYEFKPGDNYPKYPSPKIESEIRLNRFISMSGICSRREADTLIAEGKVTVNGEVVTELGTKITMDDIVRYNGKVVQGENKVYIVMNKPKGYVTTVEDPHADKTVMDLLKNSVKERVYPVGRLDKNSLGVLLITNDGDMTKKLTHPTFAKKKIYQVTLDKALTKADMQQIADGIMLDDGEVHADEINYVGDSRREIGIEIHSGRNRVIRRIFEHLGYQVQKLDRVYFAGLTKKNLRRGAWRFLKPQEVSALHSGRYE